MRARNDLTPRRVTSLWLAAHEQREGFAQHAPPVGGSLGVVARVNAGDVCDALQAPHGTGANAQGSGWREGPRIDGDARNSTRTDSRAAPLP